MHDLTIPPNRRLLIIDDNPAIHDDFRKILTPQTAGNKTIERLESSLFGKDPSATPALPFEIDSAFQGQEGLQRVQQAAASKRPYAAAFVDVRMPPGWDGIETTAKLWAVDPDLQVIICTAYSDYSWESMVESLGQSDRFVILKKPFDNIEVQQLANALVQKWHLGQQAKLMIDVMEQMVEMRTTELLKSEARFRIITENASDLIAVVDPQGRQIYNSPSYQQVLGLSPEKLAQTIAFEQIHPDDQERFRAAVQTCFATGAGQILDYRMQHQDGSWRVLEACGNPVHNARGETESLLLVARNITSEEPGPLSGENETPCQ